MDSIKLEKLIVGNMKSIFGFSLTRLGNVSEAECLASDILYEITKSAGSLKDEERFYGFMWRIAENTYAEYLRKKAKYAGRTADFDGDIADSAASILDEMVKNEELNLLRRELSLLSRQYRDAAVLYYIEDLSCSEVAKRLQISTEMVKYYLFRARKILREGMSMERSYGEKSYCPIHFEIDFWGWKKFDQHEYRDFQRRKIKGNILQAAYYTPVSLQELGIELGVALPYLEDEVSLLTEREFLLCRNGKYLTNIPIFTLECTHSIDEKLRELTMTAAEKFAAAEDDFIKRFGDRFENDNLLRWQKVMLCVHYSIMAAENGESGDEGGFVWGRSMKAPPSDGLPAGIQGFYNGCPSDDGRGSVIAINFRQTLNCQRFEYGMTAPIVCTAADCFEYLPLDLRGQLDALGYAKAGKPNFAVWTAMEYEELKIILDKCIALVSELNRRTSEIAAKVTADLAPAHIRKTAERVGAVVYRFNSIDNLVGRLFEMGWLKAADDKAKPAVCVVKS